MASKRFYDAILAGMHQKVWLIDEVVAAVGSEYGQSIDATEF